MLAKTKYPLPRHRNLVRRTTFHPKAVDWTGSTDTNVRSGILSANTVPFTISLKWQSPVVGRTLHVGTYRINLRLLAAYGYAVRKDRSKVLLRFVLRDDGVVCIQARDGGPEIPVGVADFIGL